MLKYTLIILLSLYICTGQGRSYLEDYSWRDYEGVIPSDAVSPGIDKNGKLIYIGQVLFENKLIPGKIYKDDNKIYFEWYDKEKTSTENIKILCSGCVQKFEWIQTSADKVHRLVGKIIIKGGYEQNHFTYIGRIQTGEIVNVGKIMCSANDCLGLYTTDNGTARRYSDFQILTYNPSAQANVIW